MCVLFLTDLYLLHRESSQSDIVEQEQHDPLNIDTSDKSNEKPLTPPMSQDYAEYYIFLD